MLTEQQQMIQIFLDGSLNSVDSTPWSILILTWKFPLPNWGCWGGLACVCCANPGLALPKGLKRVLKLLRPLRNGWKNVSARRGKRGRAPLDHF